MSPVLIACVIAGISIAFSIGFVCGALWASLPFDRDDAAAGGPHG